MLLGGACILQEKVTFRGTSSAHCKTAEPIEVSILPAKGICGARPTEMHERLGAVVKVRGVGGGGLSPPCFDFGGVCPPPARI